ncbi:uncharacterized protein RCO7_11645 [Rhynchosporium graminicola]|uniref:Myb-like DNA-binding domain-containing protein n=1 Tax=Rhynchosporium graminicola TaxID=2792576 RepID=A0A1E1LMX1_9HELO|nr:uncharacterized protein RCO7_11645 [Rhynchosporium commune]
MAPASNEEQFKFLISCIRYSNNGKVDFSQVAKECKIVSKGAAAKRYERMMRAHGIASNAATGKPGPIRSLKAQRSEPLASSSSLPPISKKRKADPSLDEVNAGDDDEGFSTVKREPAASSKEHFVVKEEEQHRQLPGQLSLEDAADLMQYYDTPTGYAGIGVGMGIGIDDGYDGYDGYDGHDGYNGEYSPAPSYGSGMPASSMGGGLSVGAMYGMGSQQPYGLPLHPSYGSAGMKGMQSSELPRMSYRPLIQGSSDDQGRADSPVIVE